MRLRFTRPALADLDAVLDHIATHSPEGAQRVQPRIKAIIELVRAHLGIRRRTDDPAHGDGALSLSDLLRGDRRRDHRPRGAAHGARPVRHTGGNQTARTIRWRGVEPSRPWPDAAARRAPWRAARPCRPRSRRQPGCRAKLRPERQAVCRRPMGCPLRPWHEHSRTGAGLKRRAAVRRMALPERRAVEVFHNDGTVE